MRFKKWLHDWESFHLNKFDIIFQGASTQL